MSAAVVCVNLFAVLVFSSIFPQVLTQCANCTDYGYCMEENEGSAGGCLTCACPEGFEGDCCETESGPNCDSHPCSTNPDEKFVCTDMPLGGRLCRCEEGYTGDKCDQQVKGCDPNPCSENTKECVEYGSDFQCKCNNYWAGDYCQTYTWCDWYGKCGCHPDKPNPCKNDGICFEKSNKKFKCQCKEGYTGDTCEDLLCEDNECEHGGTCYATKDGEEKCACLNIWKGDDCDEFDLCQFDKCENGGTCSVDNGQVKCDCVKGYEAERCQNITNNCAPNPCKYKVFGVNKVAKCTNLIADYECACPPGTTGKSCDTNFDDCSQNGINPCTTVDQKANCSDGLNEFRCSCGPDYTGENCTMSIIVWNVMDGLGGDKAIMGLLEDVVRNPGLIKDMMPFLLGQMSRENQSLMSWDHEDLFVWAAFEKTELDIQDELTKVFDTTLGNCFTFNHENSTKQYNLRRGGAYGGFEALMRVRQDEYLAWIDTASLLVFIHPADESIFAESVRYQLAPSAATSIITNKVSYSRLAGKYGVCVADKSEVSSYYYAGAYTTSGCLRSCYQDAVQEECDCMDPRYALAPEAKSCAMRTWECVNNITVQRGDSSTWKECKCPSPCRENQFQSRFAQNSFVATVYDCDKLGTMQARTSCRVDIEDMTRLTVYIPRLTHQVFAETPKMTFNQLISYLGGMLGMFTGICIISLIDCGFLALYLVRAAALSNQKFYADREL